MNELLTYLQSVESRLQLLEGKACEVNNPATAIAILLRFWNKFPGGAAIIYRGDHYWCVPGCLIDEETNVIVKITTESDLTTIFGPAAKIIGTEMQTSMLSQMIHGQVKLPR